MRHVVLGSQAVRSFEGLGRRAALAAGETVEVWLY